MLTIHQFILILILLIIAIGFIIYLRYLPQQRGGYCSNNNNCASNLICANNVCIYNPTTNITVFPADVCYANSECPQGYYCSNVGTCLVNPASFETEFCMLDQECTIGNYCTYEQICLPGNSIYYLGESKPINFRLSYDGGVTIENEYLGRIIANNLISTNKPYNSEENDLLYNGNIKYLSRPNSDVLILDKTNGKLTNFSENNQSSAIYNQLIFKYADVSNSIAARTSIQTGFFNVLEESFIIQDQFANILYAYKDDDDNTIFSICDDNVNYDSTPLCGNGKVAFFVPNISNIT